MVRTTSDKQNSRTFQGLFKDTKLFFKDQGLFNKSHVVDNPTLKAWWDEDENEAKINFYFM